MFVAATPLPSLSYSPAMGGLAPAPMGWGGAPRLAPFETAQQQRFVMLQQLQMLETMLDMMMRLLSGGPLQQALGLPDPAARCAPSGYQGDPSQLFQPVAPGSAGNAPAPGNYSGPLNVQGAVQAIPAGHRPAAATSFPHICAECQRQGVTDKNQVAYILATAVHESGAGKHMTEFASGQAYEGRASLGNTQSGDGPRFKGRGYVQVTGRRNYQQWSRKLGVDLVGNPELARRPEYAARILVQGMREGTFTGRRLGDYVGGGRQDFENARRVVNGRDKAGPIAAMARNIAAAL